MLRAMVSVVKLPLADISDKTSAPACAVVLVTMAYVRAFAVDCTWKAP
jgi:hypothetical protein